MNFIKRLFSNNKKTDCCQIEIKEVDCCTEDERVEDSEKDCCETK